MLNKPYSKSKSPQISRLSMRHKKRAGDGKKFSRPVNQLNKIRPSQSEIRLTFAYLYRLIPQHAQALVQVICLSNPHRTAHFQHAHHMSSSPPDNQQESPAITEPEWLFGFPLEQDRTRGGNAGSSVMGTVPGGVV
jgi:hypothetical protein